MNIRFFAFCSFEPFPMLGYQHRTNIISMLSINSSIKNKLHQGHYMEEGMTAEMALGVTVTVCGIRWVQWEGQTETTSARVSQNDEFCWLSIWLQYQKWSLCLCLCLSKIVILLGTTFGFKNVKFWNMQTEVYTKMHFSPKKKKHL